MAVSTRENSGCGGARDSRNDHGLNIVSGQQCIQVLPSARVVGVDINPTGPYAIN